MTRDELERYLYRHIPLSASMQVSVRSIGPDGVELYAPLEPNINHRHTLFGGSAAAIAILAAWSLLHVRLRDGGARLVIQRSTMRYEKPITAAFVARSSLPDPDAWAPFMRMLARRGRARIGVAAVLEQDDQAAGRFEGEFVALAGEERQPE